MKKILALVMMLCLLCGVAMAEEQAEADVENELSGDYVVFDQLGLQIWLPEGLNAAEVSEEDAASGRLAAYVADDQTAYFTVDAVNAGEMTIDQLYENVTNDANSTDVEVLDCNGLTVVSCRNNQTDCFTGALVDTNSNIIMFSMGPASSEGADAVFYYVMASLQAAE